MTDGTELMVDKWITNYDFSTDYETLADLLENGYNIVCFVTWVFSHYDDGSEMLATDVCEARYFKNDKYEYRKYQVGCRGTEFIGTHGFDEKYFEGTMRDIFIRECKSHNLKYIMPKID